MKTKGWPPLFMCGFTACVEPALTATSEPASIRRSEGTSTASGSRIESAGAIAAQLILRGPEGIPVRAIENRETLPTGTRVALWITVESQPLWLYAYHRGPQGELEALAQPAQIDAGQLRELPGSGSFYRLEGASGTETFYAVAVRTPLTAEAQKQLAAALPVGREPPPRSSTSNRIPGPTYRQVVDANGTAILSLSVMH